MQTLQPENSVKIPSAWLHPGLALLSLATGSGLTAMIVPKEIDESMMKTTIQAAVASAVEIEFSKERAHRQEIEALETQMLKERFEAIELRLTAIESSRKK